MYKFSIFVLIALLFSGCFTTQTNPQPSTQPSKPISKFIKGVIYKKSKEDDIFRYEIRATDTSNGKLKLASATSSDEYQVGDLVYAQIQDGKIVYLATIIENYINPAPKPAIQTDKKNKIKRSNITPPKEEKLNF